MRKHFTRILTTLLSLAMLLPIVVQAAPADGWTDEAEQAYQTVTELVIQRVTESKDYLATATQEENAKVVYALWTSGATVPSGFYDEYLQALADWLDLAVKRGKTAYIPGAIRTVAAMGLDVTDFAGYDLMDTLRKPELVEADEDRLDMLMDLDAAGDAGKTDEFNALREQLLNEALARQQSSGEFRYTSQWPAGLKQNGVVSEPDRFDYILLTAKSVQALAPYQSRKDVSTAIDKALNYLSGQQLSSGGFLKYSDEDVEEDAAVMEMLTALDISLADERFTKDGHTVLDGMMGWYQDFYFEEAENAPNQGFYRYDIYWDYNALWGGWYYSSFSQMPKPPIISSDEELFEEYMGEDMAALYLVIQRIYINPTAYTGLCSIRPAAKAASVTVTAPAPSASENASTIGFSKLLDEQKALFEQEVSDGSLWNEDSWMVTESDIASFARDILALEKANGGFSEEEKAQLSELMKNMMLTSKEYYYKKKSKTLSCGAVRALVALGMDPGNVEGLDYLAPLTSLDGREFPQLDDLLKDVDAVDPNVWRARGIDADMLVDEYAAAMIEYQMPNGKFDDHYKYVLKQGEDWQTSKFTNKDQVELNAGAVAALAPHTDKEYIAKSVESAIEYLSSVQLADGSFPGRDGLPDGAATLAVLDMMDAAGISLNDERFVKNGNTVADGLKTFYIDGLGFVTRTEVDADVDGLTELPSYTSKLLDFPSAVSALTYLQAAENGKFGPDGKGNSVFEIVGAALTETPLGAILLAAIVAALLAFGMARRYRRIKKEQ
mgnify:CR=1 FL=1